MNGNYKDGSPCPVPSCGRRYGHMDGCAVKLKHEQLDRAIAEVGEASVTVQTTPVQSLKESFDLLRDLEALIAPPPGRHHALTAADFGSDATGWQPKNALTIARMGGNFQTYFLDDYDLAKPTSEIASEIVALERERPHSEGLKAWQPGREAIEQCIAIECDYCANGVPVMDTSHHPRDNNVYHTGTVRIGTRDVDATYSPCKAYKIRRHFNILGAVRVAS